MNYLIGYDISKKQEFKIAQLPPSSYVWDFNDVDVAAANDPANKYYFTLKVDGVATYTNVWAHSANARTHFPQMDTPAQDCGGA